MREWHSRAEAAAAQLAIDLARAGSETSHAALDSALTHRRLEMGERAPWILLRSDSTVVSSAPRGREGVLHAPTSDGRMALGLFSGETAHLRCGRIRPLANSPFDSRCSFCPSACWPRWPRAS
jgi:hypothetical protein